MDSDLLGKIGELNGLTHDLLYTVISSLASDILKVAPEKRKEIVTVANEHITRLGMEPFKVRMMPAPKVATTKKETVGSKSTVMRNAAKIKRADVSWTENWASKEYPEQYKETVISTDDSLKPPKGGAFIGMRDEDEVTIVAVLYEDGTVSNIPKKNALLLQRLEFELQNVGDDEPQRTKIAFE